MVPGFERKWTGNGPHYEVWYGKVDIEPGVALWFRYTILDGKTREASTWAVLFHDGKAVGGRSFFSPEELAPPHTVIIPDGGEKDRFLRNRQVFHIDDDHHLDEANAIGRADEIRWDMQWTDSGRRFRYLPHFLNDIGIARSTYDACFLDIRISGEVEYDDVSFSFENRPGLLGHIQGSKIIAESWAWAHCNNFDDEDDAVFEGISASLMLGGRTLSPKSIFILYVDGERYAFQNPLSAIRADASYQRGEWQFETRSAGVTLRGRAHAPTDVAVLEYTDTDDSNLWCYNSKLADLTLHLSDPKNGIDRELRASGTSAFEFVTRDPPDTDVLI